MQKTKLGITVELLAAAVFFLFVFGGIIPALLLIGYILLCEEDLWLKKVSVKAIVIWLGFQIIKRILGWVSSVFALNVFVMSNLYGLVSVLTSLVSIISGLVSVAFTVLFVILGVMALRKKTIGIPFVDKFIEKHIG